jgi:peroxiredoxin
MKKRSPFVFQALLLGAYCLFVSAAPPGTYAVGDKAENFTLKNVDGRMVSMTDFKKAKGYIIVFTCNHCPYAQLYESRIIALHNKYSKSGYPVIAVNPNDPVQIPEDSFEEMQKRAKEMNYPFPYLMDDKQEVMSKFGPARTPQVFLLDNEMVVRYIGTIDDNAETERQVRKKYVENAIAALQKGQKPDPSLTRAVGCTVKKMQQPGTKPK